MRPINQDDKGWIIFKTKSLYGERMPDVEGCQRWFDANWNNPQVIMLRTDESFAVGTLGNVFFDPAIKGTIHFFGGQIWELSKIFKEWIRIAKERGCTELYFTASTGYNIAPLAKRIGASLYYPTYWKEL